MIILCMEKNKKLDIKCVKQLWLNYISTKVDKEPASTPCSGHVLGLQKNNVKLMSSDRHTCKWFTVAKARTSNTKNPYAIDKNQSVRQLYFPNVFYRFRNVGVITPGISHRILYFWLSTDTFFFMACSTSKSPFLLTFFKKLRVNILKYNQLTWSFWWCQLFSFAIFTVRLIWPLQKQPDETQQT